MTKNLLFLILLLTNFLFCWADEPPSWEPYTKVSENKEFFCFVYYADNDSLKQPWERKWNLNVFKKDSTLFWKRPFQPSGYDDGILTNDGNNFVIIEFWYYENADVVKILNKDFNDYEIKGKEFNISADYLTETTSHRLWRKDYVIKNDTIIIETNDNNKWEIDITNKKLSLIKNHNSISASVIIISTLILIVFLLMIYILRRNAIKTKT